MPMRAYLCTGAGGARVDVRDEAPGKRTEHGAYAVLRSVFFLRLHERMLSVRRCEVTP